MKNLAIYTVHKAASTFLFRLLKDISVKKNIALYSPNDKANPGWITDTPNNSAYAFMQDPVESPFIVGPLRRPYQLPLKSDYYLVLHIRDPRDGLVSMYHSFSKSHPGIPEAELRRRREMGIDEFVKSRANDYLERYLTYQKWLTEVPNIRYVKYEKMISQFDLWLEEFLEACHFDDDDLRNYLYNKHHEDVDPKGAIEGTHKNRMVSGQYQSLNHNTITLLNDRFRPALGFFGYCYN